MAEGYNTDVRMLYSVLLGMPESSESRRAVPRHEASPGIFGDTVAAMSVTECNGKGWNHLHQLLYAMLPSWVLQAAAGDPELHDALRLVVDVCVSAELPPEVQLQSLLASLHGFYHHRGPWHTERAAHGPDDPECKQHTAASAERVGVHATHGSRCRKGYNGDVCCSQCFSREIRQDTSPVCLVCESDDDEGGGLGGAAAAAAASDGLPKKKKYVPREAGDIPAFTPAPSSIRAPLLKDPRLLVVEPQRAKIPIDEGASDHYGRVMRAEYSEPSRDYVEEAQKDKAVTTALRRLMESGGALQPSQVHRTSVKADSLRLFWTSKRQTKVGVWHHPEASACSSRRCRLFTRRHSSRHSETETKKTLTTTPH